MKSFDLSGDMLLGVATAATQIEGGKLDHAWNDWYMKGNIHDGANPARANDHFNKWKEDINLMKSMGVKVYRLGVEWVRLEPYEGEFDESATAYYRKLLTYIKNCGIIPLLTIHHFSNPMWFEQKGGFTSPDNIPVFLEFVEYVIRSLGDLADEYITINEPNVFATKGYFEGVFPPGMRSLPKACRVMSVMAACHIKAYGLIHSIRSEMGLANTKVSFAHHMRVFEPRSERNLMHKICARLIKHMFQDSVMKAFCLGRFSLPLTRLCGVVPGDYCDFLAINYYSRSTVSKLEDGVREGAPLNDLGWEIYPQGIISCAEDIYKILPRPIYITENGTCDNSDSFRCRFIYDHIKALSESSLPVERYYHWCFCDNFEWAEGESARFGLIHVDFETQQRTIKKSARFFSSIIKNDGVTDEMYAEYVESEKYHY